MRLDQACREGKLGILKETIKEEKNKELGNKHFKDVFKKVFKKDKLGDEPFEKDKLGQETFKKDKLGYEPIKDFPKKTKTKLTKKIKKEKNKELDDKLIKNACEEGNVHLVNLTISNGVVYDWNYGLYGACKGGHEEIVNLMIYKEANDWNLGLYGACLGGHPGIIRLMIQKGACEFEMGFFYACKGGHLESINMMISIVENINWKYGFVGAFIGGELELMQLVISKTSLYYKDKIYELGPCVCYYIYKKTSNRKEIKKYIEILSKRKIEKKLSKIVNSYLVSDILKYF
jgi:hypothetical protein